MICPVCLKAGNGQFCRDCGSWMSDGFDEAAILQLAEDGDLDDDLLTEYPELAEF